MENGPVQEPIAVEGGIVSVIWMLWLERLTSMVNRNTMQGLAVYADNAAAIAGGLSVGDIYMTATGQVMVVY